MMLYSLFIGIDEYKDGRIGNLKWCARDADQFAKILSDNIAENGTV